MTGISEYFRGQAVLITGGTGFMGQALIYKLLQIGCPKIFLLIRSRKGKSAEDRLKELIRRYTFDSIRDKVDIASKLIAIPCDIESCNGLGISEEDQELIRNEVTVVLHGAASVKFDDPLKIATYTNLRMTRDVMDLAKGIKNLQLFTYVSTAYANCDHMMKGVEEKLYESKMDWRTIIEAVETLPDEVVNSLEGKLVGASPNTYTFTKHLTESLVNDYGVELPVLIVRPPIVIAALKEPEPGWMSNMNSPMAVIAASGKGVFRLFYGPTDSTKAYVPVDVAVNGTLAAVWHTTAQPRSELVPVYNVNFTDWTQGGMHEGCKVVVFTHPFKNPIWAAHGHSVTNRHLFLILHLLMNVLPGIVIDGALLITGKTPRITKMSRKMYNAYILLSPFTFMSDHFYWNKFEENIIKSIPENEKEIFYVDSPDPRNQKELHEYLKLLAVGFRALMGEPRDITEGDRLKYKRLHYLDLAVKYFVYVAIVWYIPYAAVFNAFSAFYFILVSFFENCQT